MEAFTPVALHAYSLITIMQSSEAHRVVMEGYGKNPGLSKPRFNAPFSFKNKVLMAPPGEDT